MKKSDVDKLAAKVFHKTVVDALIPNEAQKELVRLNTKLTQLRADVKLRNETIVALEAVIGSVQAERDELKESLNNIGLLVKDKDMWLDKLFKRISELEARVKELVIPLNAPHSEALRLLADNKALRESNENTREKLAGMIIKFKAMRNRASDLRAELEAERWIPVEEWLKLGETQKRVEIITAIKNNYGKTVRHVTIGEYIAPKTELAEDFLDDDCPPEFANSCYDEEEDVYWTPSGFYEFTLGAEMYMFISEEITHVRPITLPQSEDKT